MELLVDVDKLSQYQAILNNQANKLNYIRQAVLLIKNQTNGKLWRKIGVYNQLDTMATRINTNKSNMVKMGNAISQISNEYKKTENKIKLNGFSKIAISSAKDLGENPTVIERKTPTWEWNDTWKVLGKAGIIGPAISSIGQLITGGLNPTSIMKSLKFGTGVIEKTANAVSKSSFDWKTLLGLSVSKDAPRGFFGALKEEFNKLSFGKAKTASSNTAVAAKWGGHLLTGIITGYENFTDTTENNSFGRKVAETIGETGIKIGEGILLTAAATAIIGAGAPVLIAGSVVAATWAIDSAFEYFTGKDFAECTSDFILDVGEKVGEGVSNVYNGAKNAVGNAIRNTGNAIGKWARRIFA